MTGRRRSALPLVAEVPEPHRRLRPQREVRAARQEPLARDGRGVARLVVPGLVADDVERAEDPELVRARAIAQERAELAAQREVVHAQEVLRLGGGRELLG